MAETMPDVTKEIPLVGGGFAVVDAIDYAALCGYSWRAKRNRVDGNLYAYRNEDNKEVWMHRVVLPVDSDLLVDHRDGNGLNNCRSNLRPTTPQLNMANKRMSKNNSTGFKGVTFDKSRGLFRAQVMYNRRAWRLGRFTGPEDAARAYDRKATELFGEHARTNVMLGLLPALPGEVQHDR